MFALRQSILGPATAAAKRSLLVQQQSLCIPLATATETLAPSLLSIDPRKTSFVATRRNISTTIHHQHRLVEESSSKTNTAPLLASAPSSALARMTVAVASNWFVSVWDSHWNVMADHTSRDGHWSDGLFLISTLKRRRKMMNKHKLRKRRKKNRMKNKK